MQNIKGTIHECCVSFILSQITQNEFSIRKATEREDAAASSIKNSTAASSIEDSTTASSIENSTAASSIEDSTTASSIEDSAADGNSIKSFDEIWTVQYTLIRHCIVS